MVQRARGFIGELLVEAQPMCPAKKTESTGASPNSLGNIRSKDLSNFFCDVTLFASHLLHHRAMRAPNVEKQIEKLGLQASTTYFAAKDSLVNARDSRSEQFSAAAQTVKDFWKMVLPMDRR